MESWNVLVFGSDFEDPFAVRVTDPSKWTLADLKKEIITKIPSYTEADLEVYCGEKKIVEGKPLTGLDGMKNGVGVVITIKPFIINVYCSNDNVSLQVEIPRKEFNQWTVANLRSVICFKRGFDDKLCQKDIIAFSGNILADSSLISSVPDMANNCLVTYTRITQFEYPQQTGQADLPRKYYASVLLPLDIGEKFASQNLFYKRRVQSASKNSALIIAGLDTTALNYSWAIIVQMLDGSKANVVMENPKKMSIFKLRELVMKAMSVPTQKQRLTAGDTVLEDWDEEGGAMLVVHYPTLYDGATVYLVTLTDGIRVELDFGSLPHIGIQAPASMGLGGNLQFMNISKQHKSLTCDTTKLKLSAPNYLNIPCPKTFKQSTLMFVMKNCVPSNMKANCINYSSICQQPQPTRVPFGTAPFTLGGLSSLNRNEFVPSDDPVNVIKWISDGCILGLKQGNSQKPPGFM